MAINDDIGYDLDAECDGITGQAKNLEAQLQGEQDGLEAAMPAGGACSTSATTKQLIQVLRRVQRLAQIVKHLKQAVDGEAVTYLLE